MTDSPVHVSIGCDPQSWLAAQVLASSILRRTERRPVHFTYSWTPSQGYHRVMRDSVQLKFGTPFSAWRWCVPSVYGMHGRAIYLDSDQVVLGDIGELFDWPMDSGEWFAAVIGAIGRIGKHGAANAESVQTSVMLMDCGRCSWPINDLFTEVYAGRIRPVQGVQVDPHFANNKNPQRVSYGHLMQANWIPRDRIARLDPLWNAFNVCPEGTKLLHYTYSAEQPWRTGDFSSDTGAVWASELKQAIKAGHVEEAAVRQARADKHVHEKCTLLI